MLQSLMYPNMVKIVASNDDTEDGKHSFQPYHVAMANPCHAEYFYEPHSSPIYPVNL